MNKHFIYSIIAMCTLCFCSSEKETKRDGFQMVLLGEADTLPKKDEYRQRILIINHTDTNFYTEQLPDVGLSMPQSGGHSFLRGGTWWASTGREFFFHAKEYILLPANDTLETSFDYNPLEKTDSMGVNFHFYADTAKRHLMHGYHVDFLVDTLSNQLTIYQERLKSEDDRK